MWQFMPHGNYGLTRNAYVDERFDPEKSTRAYARYMKFIYDQLGDWYLSMAAYDWGAGNVQRAVQKTGYADFWELYKRNNLPGETKNYVPEILAAIIIANHPTQYGFDDITLDPPVLTDTVTINYSVDLRLVSDFVDAPMDELMALNPSLLRLVTPPDTSFDLHLPAGTAAVFEQRIAAVPESKRNAWRYHRVTPETRWLRWRGVSRDGSGAGRRQSTWCRRQRRGNGGAGRAGRAIRPVSHARGSTPCARGYAGIDRRPLWCLAESVASLEQDLSGLKCSQDGGFMWPNQPARLAPNRAGIAPAAPNQLRMSAPPHQQKTQAQSLPLPQRAGRAPRPQ